MIFQDGSFNFFTPGLHSIPDLISIFVCDLFCPHRVPSHSLSPKNVTTVIFGRPSTSLSILLLDFASSYLCQSCGETKGVIQELYVYL